MEVFTLWVPAVLSVLTLLGIIIRAAWKLHKIVDRFDDMLPTIEAISGEFPGRQLLEHLESIEHAIDMQSQALSRLAEIADRRRKTDPLLGWRPSGWEEGDKH